MEMNVEAASLDHLTERLASTRRHGIDSVVIARGGRLIYEVYAAPGGRDQLHDLRSATKSVTSMLIGIAADRGLLSVGDPVATHLVGRRTGSVATDLRVEHLLTMSGGRDCDDRDRQSPGHEDRMYRTRDWVAHFLSLDVVASPGAHPVYCTGGVVVLGEVLRGATGENAESFARAALFEPLGIGRVQWAVFDEGAGIDTGGHLRMRTRDFAKIGELVRTGGQWRGRQVISASWIEAATSPHVRLDEHEYGYLWWLDDVPSATGPHRVVFASGNGGQTLFVVPDLDLVVAFTGHNYNSPRSRLVFSVLAQVIVPAVRATTP